MRPLALNRDSLPRDELVALVLGGYLGYTLWRTVKGFREGLRGPRR